MQFRRSPWQWKVLAQEPKGKAKAGQGQGSGKAWQGVAQCGGAEPSLLCRNFEAVMQGLRIYLGIVQNSPGTATFIYTTIIKVIESLGMILIVFAMSLNLLLIMAPVNKLSLLLCIAKAIYFKPR